MKTRITILLTFCFFLLGNLYAQELKYPLEAKVTNEIIPDSPGDTYTWVKGHWDFQNGKYNWVDGNYIEVKEGYKWQDGYWERNQKTGMWVFNDGYWQKATGGIEFSNSKEVISFDLGK